LAELRTKILETAYKQFSDAGVAGISLRSIAKSLGVTHPAIYTYFTSKEELVQALRIDILRELKQTLFVDVNPHDEFKINAQKISENFIEYFDQKPAAFRLLFTLDSNEQSQNMQLRLLEYIDEILSKSGGNPNLTQIYWYSLLGNTMAKHLGEINKKREYELMYELAVRLAI
jgi:AcrR family transcriptional regulator